MKVFKIKYCSYSVITGLPGNYFEYYVSLVSLLSYQDQLQETEVSSTMSPYMQIEENEFEEILQKCSK